MPPAAKKTIGTCKTMCSSAEVQFRINNNLVHILECTEQNSNGKLMPEPQKMVKEFSRSAAGCDLMVAEHLRPTNVLEKTVDYLLSVYKERKKEKWDLVYNFVVDRLRAVRQDMVVQRLNAKDSLFLLEKMIPFYVEAEYLFKTKAAPFTDWKLHATQMEDCFSNWNSCLSTEVSYSYDILFMSFFRNSKNIEKMMFLLQFFPLELRRQALQLHSAYTSGNYVRFFRLFSQLKSTIVKQSLIDFVHDIRLHAIYTVAKAYKTPNAVLPSNVLQKWLMIDEDSNFSCVLRDFFPLSSSSVCINSFDINRQREPFRDFYLYSISLDLN